MQTKVLSLKLEIISLIEFDSHAGHLVSNVTHIALIVSRVSPI